MPKQSGFTLVELVVVIIILGILAVAAAPKFIGIQADARLAALKGLKAGIEGANVNVYGKAAIAGELSDKGYNLPLVNGDSTNLIYGSIDATPDSLEKAINARFEQVVDIPKDLNADINADWLVWEDGGHDDGSRTAKIWQKNAPEQCYLTYTTATATSAPTYKLPTASDC